MEPVNELEFKKISDLSKVQEIIQYQFNNPDLLQRALTHRSYLNEKIRDREIKKHNERLEFLGDAVLELIVSDFLFNNLDVNEGQMTKLRSSLVKGELNAEIGMELGVQNEILISRGELDDYGTARPSIVADTIEAIIGAMYIDGGIGPCQKFVDTNMIAKLPKIIADKSYNDHKTILQEYCQKHLKITPKYRVISEEGKDHQKKYQCGVWLNNKLISTGQGGSKQEAEIAAAKAGLIVLKSH